MPKEIPLTKGRVTIVDDADYEWLNQWKWRLYESNGKEYAWRTENEGGRVRGIFMHRVILDIEHGMLTDHRNRNGLDNRRENLRPATRTQNGRNKRRPTHRFRSSTSKFRGVYRGKRAWIAQIGTGQRVYHIGSFAREIDAGRAYDFAARQLHGEFASLNFPDVIQAAPPEGYRPPKIQNTQSLAA